MKLNRILGTPNCENNKDSCIEQKILETSALMLNKHFPTTFFDLGGNNVYVYGLSVVIYSLVGIDDTCDLRHHTTPIQMDSVAV